MIACRVCGAFTDGLLDVFDLRLQNSRELRQFLILSTGIQLKQTDAVSTFVCHHCCIIAVKFYKYRVNAIANDKRLKENCGQVYFPPTIDQEELHRLNASILDSVNTIQPDKPIPHDKINSGAAKLPNISKTNLIPEKTIKENVLSNLPALAQFNSKPSVTKCNDKPIESSNHSVVTVIPARNNTNSLSSKLYTRQKFKERCKKTLLHPSVKRLIAKHKDLILPVNVVCSDISPSVSLDYDDINHWFKSKARKSKSTSIRSVHFDLKKLISGVVLKSLKIKPISAIKSSCPAKSVAISLNREKANKGKQHNKKENGTQADLLKKLSHCSVRVTPIITNTNSVQGTYLPHRNVRILPCERKGNPHASITKKTVPNFKIRITKRPVVNSHKIQDQGHKLKGHTVSKDLITVYSSNYVINKKNYRSINDSSTKEDPLSHMQNGIHSKSYSQGKHTVNGTKNFSHARNLTTDVNKSTHNSRSELIVLPAKATQGMPIVNNWVGDKITKVNSVPAATTNIILQGLISKKERNEKRKKSSESDDEVIPKKKNRVFTKIDKSLQKVDLPEKSPVDNTTRKHIFTSSLELVHSQNHTTPLLPTPETSLVLENVEASPSMSLLALSSQATNVHVCHVCNTIYDTRKELKHHERIHLRCKFCKKRMTSVSLLMKHQSQECFINIIKNLPILRIHRIDSVQEVVDKYPDAFTTEVIADDIDYLCPLIPTSDFIPSIEKNSAGPEIIPPFDHVKEDLSEFLTINRNSANPAKPTVIVCISDDSDDEEVTNNNLSKQLITPPVTRVIVENGTASSAKIKPVINLFASNFYHPSTQNHLKEEDMIRSLFKKHFITESKAVAIESQTFSPHSSFINYTTTNIIVLDSMYPELFDYKIPVCLDAQTKIYASFKLPPLPEPPSTLLAWEHIVPCDLRPTHQDSLTPTNVYEENIDFSSVTYPVISSTNPVCTVPSSTHTVLPFTASVCSTVNCPTTLVSSVPVTMHSAAYSSTSTGGNIQHSSVQSTPSINTLVSTVNSTFNQKEQGSLNMNGEKSISLFNQNSLPSFGYHRNLQLNYQGVLHSSENYNKQFHHKTSADLPHKNLDMQTNVQNVNPLATSTAPQVNNNSIMDLNNFLFANSLDLGECVKNYFDSNLPDPRNLNKPNVTTPSVKQSPQSILRVKNPYELNQMVLQ